MSVFVTLRFKADPKRIQEVMSADGARWQAINGRAKGLGAIHHRFMASPDGTEVLVTDEWESAEAFQKFFEASEDIRQIMGEVGVTAPPDIAFWHALDTPDAF
jgi:heme-degrading monooxygenase HmoA